jgi:dihydroxy-acid dehydratase
MLTTTPDGLGDDIRRGLGPDERGRVIVPVRDVLVDVANQGADRLERTPLGETAENELYVDYPPCMVMGTASTMALTTEALGMMLPGGPKRDVNADDILVMKQAGPKGAPGMPEAGYIPIRKKLAQKGLKDMIRISDARMSGTAFGAIVLHVTPESAARGPLALVRNGDRIRLDVPAWKLELLVSDRELEARRKSWKPPRPRKEDGRGYRKLFLESVTQADRGCDFDFLANEATIHIPKS